MFGQLGIPDQPILYKPQLVPVNIKIFFSI